MVIFRVVSQPRGNRPEPRRLHGQCVIVGIGTAHDGRDDVQCRIFQFVFFDKIIESALVVIMGELHAGNIERRGAESFRLR
ncbi:hypothetical protein D3C87_1978090 [compost metagenome]